MQSNVSCRREYRTTFADNCTNDHSFTKMMNRDVFYQRNVDWDYLIHSSFCFKWSDHGELFHQSINRLNGSHWEKRFVFFRNQKNTYRVWKIHERIWTTLFFLFFITLFRNLGVSFDGRLENFVDGPTLQSKLFDIIRFREHPIAFCADIIEIPPS